MSQCNPTTTPTDGIIDSSGTPLDSAGLNFDQDLVGSFIYLATCTRPDIAFAVMRPSRFVAKPNHCSFLCCKTISARGRLELKRFTDTSYACDPDCGRPSLVTSSLWREQQLHGHQNLSQLSPSPLQRQNTMLLETQPERQCTWTASSRNWGHSRRK
ncbi:unnamed protein product [Discosporangium mesarthrocarpum]